MKWKTHFLQTMSHYMWVSPALAHRKKFTLIMQPIHKRKKDDINVYLLMLKIFSNEESLNKYLITLYFWPMVSYAHSNAQAEITIILLLITAMKRKSLTTTDNVKLVVKYSQSALYVETPIFLMMLMYAMNAKLRSHIRFIRKIKSLKQ